MAQCASLIAPYTLGRIGAASAVPATVPSPLAGEGCSVLPPATRGEGSFAQTPHPFEIVGTPLCPLPHRTRACPSSAHFKIGRSRIHPTSAGRGHKRRHRPAAPFGQHA